MSFCSFFVSFKKKKDKVSFVDTPFFVGLESRVFIKKGTRLGWVNQKLMWRSNIWFNWLGGSNVGSTLHQKKLQEHHHVCFWGTLWCDILDVEFFGANPFACVFLLFSAKCVFSFQLTWGHSCRCLPFTMLMRCPFAVLFPSSVRVRPEVSAADHDAAVANPLPATKGEPMTANDHLRLKFCWLPPKKRNRDSNSLGYVCFTLVKKINEHWFHTPTPPNPPKPLESQYI